jgi:exo-1,4-beta-D-glucosaminidase
MTDYALNDDWELMSTAEAGLGAGEWLPCDLPATVLGVLAEHGVIPDPFLGTNLRELPGQGPAAQNFSNHPMPEDSPFAVPWRFRRSFRVPSDAGPHLRLRFDGVNYRARMWLNGEPLGDELVGAYRVFEMDVTERVVRDGDNELVVEVAAPTPCDLAITWVDWNPSPPDKNMGIWRDVWLVDSGPIALRAPFVTSAIESGGERARLTIAGDLVNVSDEAQVAVVHAQIAELPGRTVRKTFELAPRQELAFTLTADDFDALVIEQPRLWWPRFMGEPALYGLQLDVTVGENGHGMVSDRDGFAFGIREVRSTLTERGHARFEVNGKPLLVRGAGWAPDLLLRRDRARDFAQLQYVKDMNLNCVRFEGMLERAEVLEWCDREGVLVIAGWCCCDCWEKWDKWSEINYSVSAESLRSQVRRVRRHPSMLTWWYGSDFPPPARVERAYLDVLAEERWPNAWQSSAANKPTELTGPSGLKMEGPYEYVPPGYWLEDTVRGGAFGFATEISPGAAIPPMESVRQMVGDDHVWPIDAVWNFHAGGQEFHTVMRFVDALSARYGEATGVEDLAMWSQVMTYEGQRAMFEAYTRNKYGATGVIQWMLNNSWPSMIWHLFDWYLRPGGGYFGTQKACEPLHVMYSYDDRTVVVTNQWARAFRGLAVRVRVVDLDEDGVAQPPVVPEQVVRNVFVEADGKAVVLTLPPPESAVRVVDLRLTDGGGREVSRNLYWIPKEPDVVDYEKANWLNAPTAKHADLSALRRLPVTSLAVKASVHAERSPSVSEDESKQGIRAVLTNVSDRLAFFVELRLVDASGADVLPVLWSDNYVSLLPGDVVSVRATAPSGRALPQDVHLELRGVNVPRMLVRIARDVGAGIAAATQRGDGRQAGGVSGNAAPDIGSGGVPEMPLDENAGPAAAIGNEQTARMVTSIVDVSLLRAPWAHGRRC